MNLNELTPQETERVQTLVSIMRGNPNVAKCGFYAVLSVDQSNRLDDAFEHLSGLECLLRDNPHLEMQGLWRLLIQPYDDLRQVRAELRKQREKQREKGEEARD